MSRFILQKSTQQQGWWVLTDKENGIVIRFEENKFNDTQQVTNLEDFTEEQLLRLPTIMREIGDWLATHHYNTAMPVVPFCIQQTEDDEVQFVERGKYPRFRIMIDDECTAHELAVALRKASEYLNKKSGKGGIG